MACEFKVVYRVGFSDTDMAGIVHYSNFFRYMEIAEHAFYRSLGFSVVTRNVDPPVSWPRVHAECDYKRPLYFEDEVEIHLLVAEKKPKALTYVFKFRKLNAAPPVPVARGALTVVCVKHTSDGGMAACSLPKLALEKIETAPLELLQLP